MHQPFPHSHGAILAFGVARIWYARGDGTCLFYAILHDNAPEGGCLLREQLAAFVQENWSEILPGPEITVRELVTQRGWSKEQYLKAVVQQGHYGGEVELVLLSHLCRLRLRVFMERGESWDECAQYGSEGEIRRMLYRPRAERQAPHYDLLVPREMWVKEQQQKEQERERHRNQERAPVTALDLDEVRSKALEEESRRQQQTRQQTRQQKLQAIRSQPALSIESTPTQELLELMAASGKETRTVEVERLTHPTRTRVQTQF